MSVVLSDLRQHLERMPLLNSNSTDLLDMLNLDNLLDHLDAVERKIMRDPALSGNLLRIANSPFFGHSRNISSIRHACVVLGIDAIKTIICTMLVHGDLLKIRSRNQLKYEDIWNHSMLTAFIARELVSPSIHFNAQLTFTTALFHNIHMIVMDVFYPDEFAAVIAHARQHQVDIVDAYTANGMPGAGQLNLEVMRFWRFPTVVLTPFKGIAEALEGQRPEPFMIQLIRFARVMANGLGVSAIEGVPLRPPKIDTATTLDVDMARAMEACQLGLRSYNDFKNVMD